VSSRSCAVTVGVALLCGCAVLTGGCSSAHYREDADSEVRGIIEEKSASVPGFPSKLTIEQPKEDYLRELPQARPSDLLAAAESPGLQKAKAAPQPLRLTLAKALEIAQKNSRQLQDQGESLYLSALSLTLARYRFAPHLFGTISGRYKNLQTDETVGADTSFGFNWLLRTGADVGIKLGSTFLEYLTGDPRKAASSLLELTITQPLLKGRGLAARESLTQAERDVLYDLREFVRFRRTFFVGVTSDYYRVLERRQVVENERMNHESLVHARKRAEDMAKEGRLPKFEVDQTRQDELRAQDRLEAARERYQQVLDEFKLKLALPVDAELVLAPEELNRLRAEKIEAGIPPGIAPVEIAIRNRLDLMTAADKLLDAERKVRVALNELKPGLDLVLKSSTDTSSGVKPVDLEFSDSQYTAGLDLELPLDRKSERNEYRKSIIELQKTERNYQELRDRITLDVRGSWRSFHRAQSSYEIQKNSVALAERRVESTTMLLDEGRASTRDMLDARESLLVAQNALTGALVDYRIARLELARDMDTLKVKEDGTLEENFEAD